MLLTCVRQHRSIAPCDPFILQDFVILIGPNGSGKSHFLEAIKAGAMTVSIENERSNALVAHENIVLLKAGSSVNAAVYQPEQEQHRNTDPYFGRIDRRTFETRRESILRPHIKGLQELFSHQGEQAIPDSWNGWALGVEAIVNELGARAIRRTVEQRFAKAESDLKGAHLSSSARGPDPTVKFCREIRKLSELIGRSALEITYEDYVDYIDSYSSNAFEIDFAKAIGRYSYNLLKNDIESVRQARGEVANALDAKTFEDKYGRHPADEMSALLNAFGIPYKVVKPNAFPSAEGRLPAVKVEFLRNEGGAPFGVEGLSSGELVVYQFLLPLLTFDPHYHRVSYPQIILLDEMDAALHPQMAKRWLDSIQRSLVQERNIKCIIATHSPTTVALADGAAIMEMRYGCTKPESLDKQVAVNRLTAGIPTLALDFSGRRQVIAESTEDAEIYQKVLTKVQGSLALQRSLVFSTCGVPKRFVRRSLDGQTDEGVHEANGGCAAVRKLVGFLSSEGNQSVYGVVDWDRTQEPAKHIHVLAQGTHYTLENVLLDPLLIAHLCIAEGKFPEPGHNIAKATQYSSNQLQHLADVVSYQILGLSADGETDISRYLSGLKIRVPRAMRQMKGHDLEDMVREKLHWFRGNRYQRGLKHWIIDAAIDNFPGLCPSPFVDLFEELAADLSPS